MSKQQTAETVTAALVAAGLVETSRAAEAAAVVQRALAPQEPGGTPLRRRMAEIAGYVGAAFVVGAAALFFANEWDTLGHDGQVGVLAGITLVLLAAAGAVVAAGGLRALTSPTEQVRRRLASVLATAGAATAGFTVGLVVPGGDSGAVLAGAATALVVALVGYRLAPSVVGQAGAAVAAFVAIPAALDLVGVADGQVAMGLAVLALGLLWLALAETGVWREVESGRVLAAVLAVLGAQLPVFGDHAWVGYVATAVVGVAAFAGYVVRPAWPYLAAGVVALTLAVPEALTDWTSGSLGPAGILLATGVTLLVAALLGLRLRHEVPGRPRT
ncbi:MAG: hypothetical protein ACTHOK_04260 [Nocardioidaceae bacterium]